MKLSNIEFTIGTFKEVFNETLEIKDNSLTFVCGESGSGKSLFVNHLSKMKEFKNDVFISQTNSYPPLNYKVEDLLSFISIDEENIESFLNKIANYFDLRPYLKKKLKNLSGGEKSFINLIISLYSYKKIIILDEPLNMISENNKMLAAQLIKELSKRKTIIIVSHFKELFMPICDYCIEFKKGVGSVIKNEYQEKEQQEFITSKINPGKRIKRYLKDDLPLIALFFAFTICIQFILFFTIARNNLSNRKILHLEDTPNIYHFNRINADLKNTGSIKDYNLEELTSIEDADYFQEIYFEDFYYNTDDNYGLIRQELLINKNILYLDDYNYDELSDFNNSSFNRVSISNFYNITKPALRRTTSSCIGKCHETLSDDELIVGNGIASNKKWLEAISKHDFSTPLEVNYVYNINWSYSLSSENISIKDKYNEILNQKWLADGAIFKKLKIVGFDQELNDAFIISIVPNKMSSTPWKGYQNFLEIQPTTKNESIYVNFSEFSDEDLLKKLNDKLIYEYEEYDCHYVLNKKIYYNSYDIALKRKKVNSRDLSTYLKGSLDKINSVNIALESDEDIQIEFVRDNSFVYKNLNFELARKMNPKTDIVMSSKTLTKDDLGKKVKLYDQEFTLYGIIQKSDINATHCLDIQWLSLLEKSNVFDYESKENRDCYSFSIQYKNDTSIVAEMNKINNIFKEKYPNFKIGLDTKLSDTQKQELIEYYMKRYNQIKTSEYVSLTLMIIGFTGTVFLIFAFYITFKKNYAVNKYKKNLSKANYLIPLVISVVFIGVVGITCFMKSLPYYICTYYFIAGSLNFELTNKIQNTVNIISLVMIGLIAVYLYLRNVIIFNIKRKRNHK